MMRPKAQAVTFSEGGNWVSFPCRERNTPQGILVHSIKFDDGSIWDAYNGWRPSTLPEKMELDPSGKTGA
jgi:hypothetical protein